MDKLGQKENNTFAHKKALFVANQDSFVELFLLPCMKILKERGYEVHVATDTDKTIPLCDKKIKLTIERSPFKFRDNLKAVRELKNIMAKEGYEIVHCHTPVGGMVARLAAKKFRHEGTRVIYTAHGFHFFDGAPLHFWLMFYPVEKWLAKYTDTLITINDEDYKRASSKFSRRCYDIRYVPGVGVDPDKFSKKMSAEERVKLRSRFGLAKDDRVLIFPAELSKRKNQMWLIGALAPLFKEDKKYHLLLPGKDSLDGECQKFTARLDLEKQIHFLGFRKNISELLQISDVLVSSAKQEGLPVNLMEAVFMGLPIVATDCRGNRDVCRAAGQQIVEQNNNSEMREAVKKVFDGCFDATKKRQSFIDRHNMEKVQQMIGEIYFKKKRVLHLLASNKYSGAENVACTIISNLSDDFDMVYCSPRGPIEEMTKKRGVKYFGIDKLNCRNLKKIIREFRPDIIHAHDFRASLVASRFGKKYEVVSHIHLDNPKVRKFGVWSVLYWISTSKYKNIIWVSESAFKNYYFKNSKRIKKKSIVLRNVIDGKYIRAKANEYKVDDSFDLVFIGRLSEQKNPERAIEIVRMIKGYKNDIKMAMIGDGEKYNKIKKMIAEYGLQNNIKLYGFVGNPYPILKNAKILFMTSKFEGTPMVILEAQALGKPIVSTRVGGLEKLVKNGENGFLSDSDGELVRNVMKILNSKNVLEVGADCMGEYLTTLNIIYNSQPRTEGK